MAKGVPGSSIIWIGVAIIVAVYAWWLSSQVDIAREQALQAQAREQALVVQVQQLAARMGAGRDENQSDEQDALAVALLRRPDLIPLAPQLGGRYYFLEDTVRVLSDRYLYVQVEDGHVMGHMLLAYERDGDAFTFDVIDAYID